MQLDEANGKDIQADCFLSAQEKGYEMFLYLSTKYPLREDISPAAPIDIIWHTHQCFPSRYHADMMRY
jgi:hypothetical protein